VSVYLVCGLESVLCWEIGIVLYVCTILYCIWHVKVRTVDPGAVVDGDVLRYGVILFAGYMYIL